jgi:membrane fusion protein (multidrug efflux system)
MAAPSVKPSGDGPAIASVAGDTPPKRKRAPFVIGGLVLAAAAVAVIYYVTHIGKVSTDDAQVEAHVQNVAVRIAGQVKTVLVKDNQEVKAGDVLVILDDSDQIVRVKAATADLKANNAQLRAAKTQESLIEKTAKANLAVAQGGVEQASSMTGTTQASIEQAKADVAAAESRKTLTKTERDRAETLHKGGAMAQSELDVRVAADLGADAALAQAKARLESALANRGNTGGSIASARGKLLAASTVDEQLDAAKAQVELAQARVDASQAALDRANLEEDYTKVKAEITGTVAKRSVEPGQIVSPERPLMAVVDLSDTWIVANLKETQLEDVKAGQSVDIEVDTFGGKLHGKVDSIAAGTGSRFSLLPPDNASGNFIKVTQRVPVKIVLERSDKDKDVLRPGMSADVTIHTK